MIKNLFGQEVRRLRKEQGKKIKRLAQELGFSITYMSDIERGERLPPSIEKIKQLADFLDVAPVVLIVLAAEDRGYIHIPTAELENIEIVRLVKNYILDINSF